MGSGLSDEVRRTVSLLPSGTVALVSALGVAPLLQRLLGSALG